MLDNQDKNIELLQSINEFNHEFKWPPLFPDKEWRDKNR